MLANIKFRFEGRVHVKNCLAYKNPGDKRIKERMANGNTSRMPYSWFEFNLVKNTSRDKTFHACQILLPLFKMPVNAGAQKGDLVFILFGGSGSEIVRAKEMERNYLSCEIHPQYYKMIQERLKHGGVIADKYRLPRTRKNTTNNLV